MNVLGIYHGQIHMERKVFLSCYLDDKTPHLPKISLEKNMFFHQSNERLSFNLLSMQTRHVQISDKIFWILSSHIFDI